jgi:hypothetical protein
MASYSGMPDFKCEGTLKEGMVTDIGPNGDGTIENFRRWHYRTQNRIYSQWVDLNDNRDLTSDLDNLCGTKTGRFEFIDDWYNVFPKRRRARRLYPDEITPQ